MITLIELEDGILESTPILVNLDHIVCIFPCDIDSNQTHIQLVTGKTAMINMEYSKLKEYLTRIRMGETKPPMSILN